MNKNYIITTLLLIFTNISFSQYTIGTNLVELYNCSTSTDHLFDSGGSGGSYSDNENTVTTTICPNSATGQAVFATMLIMDISEGDSLVIYNGPNNTYPRFSNMPLDNSNTNYSYLSEFQPTTDNIAGCITFEFFSNGDGDVGNFEFEFHCEARCQSFSTSFSSSIPDTTLTPTDVYLDVCLGDTIFLNATNDFFDNNTAYTQSDATSTFEWFWSPSVLTPDTGISQSHYYNQSGGYVAKVISYDIFGCRSYSDFVFKVRIAEPPVFQVLADSILCFGASDTLAGLPEGIIINGQVIQGDTVFFVPPFYTGDTTFLPDGTGATHVSNTFVSGFDNGAVIENCGDVVELCMTLEHSYSGDLDIVLTCPNGQTVDILTFGGGAAGSTNFGEPFANSGVDGLSNDITQGIGYNYCFSMVNNNFGTLNAEAAAYNYTYTTVPSELDGNTYSYTDDYFPSGTYLPTESLLGLIGCPINGNWSISITDNLGADNGWLFDWSLNIDGCMAPDVDSFVMVYDFGYWDDNDNIVDTIDSSNEIDIYPTAQGIQEFTYNTNDQFGCGYSIDYYLWVDSFVVHTTPDSSMYCFGDDTITLSTTVNEPETCEYAIDMHDLILGWEGNTVAIIIDGVNTGLYTIDNFDPDDTHSLENFTVSNGQFVEIQYNNTGGFQNEVSYNILNALGDTLFSDGPSPTPGIAFDFTAACSSISYEWSPNSNMSSISDEEIYVWPTTTTEYIVSATNGNACVAKDTAMVYITNINNTLSNDVSICDEQTVDLTATGATNYTWTPSATLTDPTQSVVTSTPLVDVTYYVEFETNGCIKTDSVTVTVDPNLSTSINNGINPVFFCEGESIDLEAINLTGITYSWSGPESGSGNSINVTTPGTYVVSFDNGSCSGIDSIDVEENPLPNISFNGIETILCCEDDSITITYSDLVNNTSIQSVIINGNLITNSSQTIYSDENFNGSDGNQNSIMKIISTDGCISEVYMPAFVTKCAQPTFTHPDTIFSNSSETFELFTQDTEPDNTAYVWTTTDGSTGAITDPNIANAQFNGTDAGLFQSDVTVINTYGTKSCSETTETKDYEVVDIADPVYSDAFTPDDGNEVNNLFRPVTNQFATITDFRIYNRWGSLVYDINTAENKDGWDGRYNGVAQKADLYIYYISVDQPNNKFVKEGSVTLLR